jgi:coiled-coil domain-containing protein 12
VERAVEGLAEQIIKEDEEKRKEELVRPFVCPPSASFGFAYRRMRGGSGRSGADPRKDLFNIQPRRANWDLKRDMTNRMAKLERRTNESIAAIFRECRRIPSPFLHL